MVLDGTVHVGASAHEKLAASLTPILGHVPASALTDGDVAYLAGHLSVDPSTVNVFASASLAATSKLPVELFVGLLSQGLPGDLSMLLAHSDAVLSNSVADSLAANLVPHTLATSGALLL